MRSLLIVSLVFAVAYLLARPMFSARTAFLGFRVLFLSGTELLLVGYLIGPRGMSLLPEATLRFLQPLLEVAIGWAGLLIGLQFNRRMIKVYPLPRYALAFLQCLVTAMLVGAGCWLLFPLLWPLASELDRLRVAALVGAVSGVTSPSSIYYFARLLGLRGRLQRLLKFIAGVDAIPSILFIGVVSGFAHVSLSKSAVLSGAAWMWLLVAGGLGVVLGVVLSALVTLKHNRDELLLFIVGMVVFASGAAHFLHLSGVFVCFVAGVTTANLTHQRDEIHKVTSYGEQPIYLTFLILAGAWLVIWSRAALILGAALIVLRLGGKVLGNLPWRWFRLEPDVESPWLGLGLLSQGGIVVVLALDFLMVYKSSVLPLEAAEIFSAVVFSVLIDEVLSPLFLRWVVPTEREAKETA